MPFGVMGKDSLGEGPDIASGIVNRRALSEQIYAENLSSGNGGSEVIELCSVSVDSVDRRSRGKEMACMVEVKTKTLYVRYTSFGIVAAIIGVDDLIVGMNDQ